MSKLSLRNKNVSILFALFLTFSLLLVGCGDKASNGSSQENDKAEESNTEESSSREITHAMGTTTIEGTPTKIVTLYQGATDVAVAMGIKPVGAVESWAEAPFYNYLKKI